MTLPISEWTSLAWSQLWQVTALTVAVSLATVLFCRRRPHLAYVLWMLVLLKCLTPPFWSSPTGLFSWAQSRVAPVESVVQSNDADVMAMPVPASDDEQPMATVFERQRREFSTEPAAAVAPAVPAPVMPVAPIAAQSPVSSWWDRVSITEIVAAVWIVGSLGFAGLLWWKWSGYRRVLRHSAVPFDAAIERLATQLGERLGLRRKVRVVVTSEPIGPAVFGLLRPVVVLPRALILPSPFGRGAGGKGRAAANARESESCQASALTLTLSQRERGLEGEGSQRERGLEEERLKRLEPILAHELVHVRRGDTLWGTLQLAVEIVWWFHPLVWWANRETCRERERCCDEEVVAGLKCRPAAYARCLLDVLESERKWQPVLAVPGVRFIEVTSKRLEDIMSRSSSFHARTPRWSWAVLIVAAALVLPGRAIVLGQGQNQSPAGNEPQAQQTPPTTEKNEEPTMHHTIITGQVVDAAGKAIAGAQVAVVGRSRNLSADSLMSDELKLLGLAKADGEGRFQLSTPKLSSAAYYEAHAVAVADGCNLGWQSIGLDVGRPQATITLAKEQTIHGRLVDAKGSPAAGAKVYVASFGKPLPGDFDGIQCWTPPSQLPFWPKPMTTDRDGRFTLRGVDRSQILHLQVRDDRFALDRVHVGEANGKDARVTVSPSGEVTISPQPARIFEGTITYDDTHKPVANARVEIGASYDPMSCIMNMVGQTNAEGRFRLNPWSGKIFFITVCPPDGEPYLTYQKEIKLADGQQPPKIEIALPRGVLLRGKITCENIMRGVGASKDTEGHPVLHGEVTINEPLAGATVTYQELSKSPYRPDRILPDHSPRSVRGVSRADGSYKIAVPPGPGTVFIQGPKNDFIRQTVNTRDFYKTAADVQRYLVQRHYVAAYATLDLKPNEEPAELNLAIRRGVTVKGTIVGPDNGPPGDVLIVSRHFMGFDDDSWNGGHVTVKNGQFVVHGLDPKVSVPFYFLDPKNETGATIEISGSSGSDEPLVVHLQPCGKAAARFVTPKGGPKAKYCPSLMILISPGPFRGDDKRNRKEVSSDQDFVANFDREHYWTGPLTDADGRCTFIALIPGATYRLPIFNKLGDWDEKDFSVKSGETLQLPEITVKEDK